jgi:hypothetical protein
LGVWYQEVRIMKRTPIRRGVALALVLMALAAAMALSLGVFHQERAAAALEPDLVVTISPNPGVGTTVANGSVIHYDIVASNIVEFNASNVGIEVWVAGGNLSIQGFPGTCLEIFGITSCTIDIPGNTAVTLSVDVAVTAGAGSSVYLGAYVDPPTPDQWYGTVLESEFGRKDFGDDEALECAHVGEDEDASLTLDGIQLEPDNYDCTKHDVAAAATPAPTVAPTTGVLHNCPLPGKWAISVWDGPDGTPTANALATCTGVSIGAVYSLDPTTNGWSRYFTGRPDVSNLLTVDDMEGIITLGQ